MKKTENTAQKHGMKHKKLLVLLLVFFVALIIAPTTALAYAGFVPGVTPLMNTNMPVDLGVQYSLADFRSLQQKTQLEASNYDQVEGGSQDLGEVSPGINLVMFGANSKEVTLTQEELTAFLNLMPWTASPLSDSQVRLSDGIVEFSGNIKSAYVSELIRSLYPEIEYEQLHPVLKFAGRLHNPAVYLKASMSAVNTSNGPAHGQFTLKILALKVNRIDLSDNISNMKELTVTIPEGSHEKGIAYSLSSLTATEGSLNLYGTIPTSLSVGGGDPTVICNNYHGGSLVSLSPVKGRIGSTLTYCQ